MADGGGGGEGQRTLKTLQPRERERWRTGKQHGDKLTDLPSVTAYYNIPAP